MSMWMDRADAVAAYIGTVVPSSVAVTVTRELDIVAEVDAKFSKASKFVAAVTWLGGQNPDRKSCDLRLGSRFSVTLWTRPDLMVAGDPVPDVTAETIAKALHGWKVDPTGSPLSPNRMEVVSIDPVPHAKFRIIEIRAEVARL